MTSAYWLLSAAAAAAAALLFVGFFGGAEQSVLAPVAALGWSCTLLYFLPRGAP